MDVAERLRHLAALGLALASFETSELRAYYRDSGLEKEA
jgi:hypothetical protein